MSNDTLEKELALCYQELGENGGSPELLVRARALAQKCHALCDHSAQLIHDVVLHSPARLSLQAVKKFHGTEVAPQVTPNLAADLKRTIDRIDSAEVSLLIGLGEMAQRIAHEESVYRAGMSQVHSKFKTFICTPVNGQLDPKVIAEAAEFFQQPARIARSIGIEYVEQADKLVLSIGYSEEPTASPQPIKIECVVVLLSLA